MCYNKEVFKLGRVFKLKKDPYGYGFNIYKKSHIEINQGVTILVGCNGIGKTTFLYEINDILKEHDIPCIVYDNFNDGGKESISESLFYGDLEFVSKAIQSSEGESIILNINKLVFKFGQFVKTGTLYDTEYKNKEVVSERWILLDAVDSGLSVDNVVDIKEKLFKTILEYNLGNEIYIVISANEYEMVRNEQCFDVYNGKYVTFKDYDDYRNMILESKKWKEERVQVREN